MLKHKFSGKIVSLKSKPNGNMIIELSEIEGKSPKTGDYLELSESLPSKKKLYDVFHKGEKANAVPLTKSQAERVLESGKFTNIKYIMKEISDV